MIVDSVFHYCYYELSENWQQARRDAFLSQVNSIRNACRELTIENRAICDLKLSHFILIIDADNSCAGTLNECLEHLQDVGEIGHNPVKAWLPCFEHWTLHNFESTTESTK